MARHQDLTLTHRPYRWVVANAAARTALVVAAGDLYKMAYQLDDGTSWVLSATGPATWTQLGTTSGVGLTEGLQAYYRLDNITTGITNAAGATAYNLTRQVHSGTGPVTGGAGTGKIDSTCVVFGGNGNGGRLIFNPNSNARYSVWPDLVGSWTMAFWVWVTAAQSGNSANIISKMNGSAPLQFRSDAGGTVWGAFGNFTRVSDNATLDTTWSAGFTLPYDAWHHVVVGWDEAARNGFGYLNNAFLGNVAIPAGYIAQHDGGNRFCLGHNMDSATPAWNFHGRLNGFGIWRRALSAANVAALWNGGAGTHPV